MPTKHKSDSLICAPQALHLPVAQTLSYHHSQRHGGVAAASNASLAAIPNVTLLEAPWGNRDAEMNICWPYPEVVDGYALSLEGLGLGIQFDEELAASKPFVPSLQPQLVGLDGSVRDF